MRHFLAAAVAAPVLLAASAFAADLPRRNFAPSPAPLYAAPMGFSWSGFYAGVNAGYGFGSFGSLGNVSFDKPDGFTVGGTLGYNHQINSLVLGAEGDFNWSGMKSSGSIPTTVPVYYSGSAKWLGTARVRAGFAADRALVYATAGYAGASIKTGFTQALVGGTVSGSESSMSHGWAVGGGIEYAFTNQISVKAEYLYVSLGKKTVFAAPYTTQADFSGSVVRGGVNYHF